jgi:hypothetical protein
VVANGALQHISDNSYYGANSKLLLVVGLDGPWLLKGDPGSGKSTIALYCIRSSILRAESEFQFKQKPQRILFTTFTKALTNSSSHPDLNVKPIGRVKVDWFVKEAGLARARAQGKMLGRPKGRTVCLPPQESRYWQTKDRQTVRYRRIYSHAAVEGATGRVIPSFG